MPYLDEQGMQDGSGNGQTLSPGQKAKVILLKYEPFLYGDDKDKTMPKHLAINAETQAALEFVGFAFHDEVKKLNDSIVEEVTVLEVECIDNDTKYPDYAIKVVEGGTKSDDPGF